ncbi:carboxypeptidase-like regulatory domain-containing protein [Pedobacter metabolipauper]|uniref:Uncharacterized protein n=1 Tax=Pedobacter metabolipauper TaxID=425513 RepID=A0A4R6STP6_9SPHI|nr:carboxypeptidase-like regulatory domain-containing protein [Pedobacter metabolipauper]TDQ08303.1 hypothetical protein ATK78_2812 [Pedobacter metabolipauper]
MSKTIGRIQIVAVSLMVLSLCSCVSRLSRPQITGVVVDYDKKPVAGCKVGEVFTNKDGRFTLPERRYNAFILSELMVMEAPPLMVHEPVEKNGYEKDAISMFSSHGGGQSKGAKYSADTIFLKKTNQQFDISALLSSGNWKLSYTKNADTIYLIKDGFKEWCKTERCEPFYNAYEVLTDNYYHTQAKNLPAGMIKRFINVQFDTEKAALQLQETRQYESTFDGPNKEPDLLTASGTWKLITHEIIQLDIDRMKSISGKFKVSDIDLYQLKLTR